MTVSDLTAVSNMLHKGQCLATQYIPTIILSLTLKNKSEGLVAAQVAQIFLEMPRAHLRACVDRNADNLLALCVLEAHTLLCPRGRICLC